MCYYIIQVHVSQTWTPVIYVLEAILLAHILQLLIYFCTVNANIIRRALIQYSRHSSTHDIFIWNKSHNSKNKHLIQRHNPEDLNRTGTDWNKIIQSLIGVDFFRVEIMWLRSKEDTRHAPGLELMAMHNMGQILV